MKYHTTKDGRHVKKGLYYYMNRAKNRGTSKPDKGSVSDKALKNSARTAKKLGGYKAPSWTRKAGKNPEGGLNAAGVASYRAANPGSKLKMAVTGKVKPGSKAAKRRKSFCARMKGMPGPMKKPNGEPTRKALSLRKWKC